MTMPRIMVAVATFSLLLPLQTLSEECLKYAPNEVTLKGTFHRKTFPGFPNYSSIEKGDHADIVIMLRVDQPICVAADPSDQFNESEKEILDIQLDGERNKVSNWPKPDEPFPVAKVVVKGTLYHQNWGYEHTKVLMAVKNLRYIASTGPTSK